MSTPRRPLSGILPGGGGDSDDIFDQFDAAEAADEFGPLPKGVYVALAVEGGMTEARTGTKGYRVAFRVLEGEFAGRRVWRTWYFTRDALPYTKRDLTKFGIDTQAKLRQPFPAGRFVFKLAVTLRTLDDGTQANEVKTLELVRVEDPRPEPFAPADGPARQSEGETAFPFGADGEVKP